MGKSSAIVLYLSFLGFIMAHWLFYMSTFFIFFKKGGAKIRGAEINFKKVKKKKWCKKTVFSDYKCHSVYYHPIWTSVTYKKLVSISNIMGVGVLAQA